MAKFEFKGWFGGKTTEGKNTKNEFFRTFISDNSTPSIWGFGEIDRERYAQYLTDEEKGNGVIAAIVNSIADTASELFGYVELVDSEGEVVTEGSVLDRLNIPNDLDTKSTVIRQIICNLLTVGDAFVYGEWNGVDKTRSDIYVMPSHLVEIVNGGLAQPIKGYRVVASKGKQASGAPKLTPDNTLFIRLAGSDSTKYYGSSPLTPIRKDIDTLDTAKRLQNKLLDEGGVRNLICISQFPEGRNIEALKDLVTQRLNDKNAKSNEVMVVPVNKIAMGDSAADLALSEVIKTKTEAICNAYGYPTNLFYRDSTFSNLAEAKKEKYTITIPYVNMICEALTKFMLEKDSGLKFQLNTDHIEELKPDYTGVVNSMRDFATKNEVRTYLGLPPIDGGDVLLVSMGQMPLSEALDQGEGETD